MIGTDLVEKLVQATAISHLIRGYDRASLLLLAAPESGKTTISTAAHAKHVTAVSVITARSVLREISDHPKTEFLLFNDLSSVRALSHQATALLIVILNQMTQDERGLVAFAGAKEVQMIDRPIGLIGCLPWSIFADHRARWKEMGFISRMIPFAYSYPDDLVAKIKDHIDAHTHQAAKLPRHPLPKRGRRKVEIHMEGGYTKAVRNVADARAKAMKQKGIRLLRNYHVLIRAHALLHGRHTVNAKDLLFLRAVDDYVSIAECRELR